MMDIRAPDLITPCLYHRGPPYPSSDLTHHPHVHMIVPGGGLSEDGSRWVSSRPGFLVHVNVLSHLFRGRFLTMRITAHVQGRLSVLRGPRGTHR